MNPHESTFAELIANLEDKHEWAVQELIQRYGSHILRVVRRHLGRKLRIRFDSEDFAQAVWATLFLKPSAFGQIQTEQQLIAFLTQIAFHKVIDQRRANTLTQRRSLNREVSPSEVDSEGYQSAVTVETPSQYVIADEQLEQMRNELPDNIRWMIECRMEGMTYESIAERGGFHERTVRRIFETLKRKFAKQ